ncbi:MAG: DUF1887 family protein [Rhodoferax sp.]
MPHTIRHLVAFVADQCPDAISAALDSRFGIERITLVGQPHQIDDIEPTLLWLRKRLNLPVQVRALGSPAQPAQYLAQATQLLRDGGAGAGVNLNTEDAASACLMLMAAQALNVPVFAVDTRSDRLIWLGADAAVRPSLDIEDRLRCADVFEMQGYTLQAPHPILRRTQKFSCAPVLLSYTCRDESMLGRLVPKTGLQVHPGAAPPVVLQTLQQHGLLVRDARGRLSLPDHDAAAFLRGGWLELVVVERLRQLAPTLGALDVRHAVQIRHRESGQVIEFDVVCMMNNQLHIIECKSGDSRGAKFVSHLEGITRSHGLRARCMLISVDTLSDALVAVAQGMHIACVHGTQLTTLDQALSAWLTQARTT